MGYKKVCIDCRKAFNYSLESGEAQSLTCPQCGGSMIELYHLFQPPKTTDKKKWDVVRYLVSQGFRYHHIRETELYDDMGRLVGVKGYVRYPETMREAIEFAEKYKGQI